MLLTTCDVSVFSCFPFIRLQEQQINIWQIDLTPGKTTLGEMTCYVWMMKEELFESVVSQKIIRVTFITVKKLPEHFLTRNLTVVYKTIVIKISLLEISYLLIKRHKTQMLKMQVPQHSTPYRLLQESLNASAEIKRLLIDIQNLACNLRVKAIKVLAWKIKSNEKRKISMIYDRCE